MWNDSSLVRRFVFIGLLVFLFASCGEDIPSRAQILDVNIETKKISYQEVDIEGIVSLSEFEGENFKYLSDAKLKTYAEGVTQDEVMQMSVKEINDLMYSDKGVSPRLRYYVKDDTIIPYSLEDSILLTLHYNLRKSLDYFKQQGLNVNQGADGRTLEHWKVFFELNFLEPPTRPGEEPKEDAMQDNAMYYPPLNALGFLKQKNLKHLALVSNPMVISHEFAHAIFGYAAEGLVDLDRNFFEYASIQGCDDAKNNFYKGGMNEGFSDYWAARIHGSSDLFYLSITKKEMGIDELPFADRSLENDRKLLSMMLIQTSGESCMEETNAKSYYWAGTIWASALWEASKTAGIENFDKHVMGSYACLATEFNKSGYHDITMATPGNCLVKTLKDDGVESSKVTTVCNILKNRFDLISGEFDACN